MKSQYRGRREQGDEHRLYRVAPFRVCPQKYRARRGGDRDREDNGGIEEWCEHLAEQLRPGVRPPGNRDEIGRRAG